VIGMHRSGTSVVSRVLEQLGVFQGHHKDTNNEPYFFLHTNHWMLRAAGATWERPLPMNDLIDTPVQRERVSRHVRHWMSSPRSIGYLGVWQYASGTRLLEMGSPWGWKDPRNTFTLPLWLDVFPDASVIHVVRHGVDVANSLYTRQQRNAETIWNRYIQRKNLHLVLQKKGGFSDTIRGSTLKGALDMWCEYVDQSRVHLRNISRGHEVVYEEFLANPETDIRSLASFLQRDLTSEQLNKILSGLEASRAFAFRGNEALRQFSADHSDILASRGYEP